MKVNTACHISNLEDVQFIEIYNPDFQTSTTVDKDDTSMPNLKFYREYHEWV